MKRKKRKGRKEGKLSGRNNIEEEGEEEETN